MRAERRQPPVVRGTFPVGFEMAWLLDGPGAPPDAPLVLALHGQGMDEDLFAILLQKLFDLPCSFLLPRAPWPFEVRRESRIGASWYPYDGDAERFHVELGRTEAMVLGLLRHVEAARSLSPRRRIVLGFSQGGYLGGVVALRHLDLFNGLIVAGARVKTEVLSAEIAGAAVRRFPVLLCHGERDTAVRPDAARASADVLAAAGVPVVWRAFDAGHALGRGMVAAMRDWLQDEVL